ncbi:helix-turn-helix domain-containing protein [Spirillospora sp. NPDC127200]
MAEVMVMKWLLKEVAGPRCGLWSAAELRRAIKEAGHGDIGENRARRLWKGEGKQLRRDDIDLLCAVLGCTAADLIQAEPPRLPPAGP